MEKEKKYYKSLSDISGVLGIPYTALYRHRHRPEFNKTQRGYNLNRIRQFLDEQQAIKQEEEKTKSLLGAEEELLEKQLKIETARHKCRLLELQILQKEGNLVEVNKVIQTRTKQISRLRRGLLQMVRRLPNELKNNNQDSIRIKLSQAVNGVLSDLSQFIQDNWEQNNEQIEQEIEE